MCMAHVGVCCGVLWRLAHHLIICRTPTPDAHEPACRRHAPYIRPRSRLRQARKAVDRLPNPHPSFPPCSSNPGGRDSQKARPARDHIVAKPKWTACAVGVAFPGTRACARGNNVRLVDVTRRADGSRDRSVLTGPHLCLGVQSVFESRTQAAENCEREIGSVDDTELTKSRLWHTPSSLSSQR